MMPNPSKSESSSTARRSTPTSSKSSSTAPDAESATSTRPPTPSSPKSTQLPSPMPIPELPQSSPMPFQSQTTSKSLLLKKKNNLPHDGFSAKVLILEETLIGYVHNLSPPRRNRGNTMNYCTFVLQTSAQETLEALLYSTHKRPLLLESQNNHTPVKLKHFTYTDDRDKIIVNNMTNIAIPQQCEYSFQYDETALLQDEPITILDILNTHKEWDIVSVRGKILNVKEPRSVGSPRK